MLYTIWLYAIRRKTECNRFRKKMYVTHRRWNVINPRERNIQVLRLDDIPFALQTDYIRLTAITYQSFGLDKNKALVSASALFFVYGLQKRYFCRFSVWLRTLTLFSEVSAAPKWCSAIAQWCIAPSSQSDVICSASSRAKRTSLAKQTSRPRGTSRSACGTHRWKMTNSQVSWSFFWCG